MRRIPLILLAATLVACGRPPEFSRDPIAGPQAPGWAYGETAVGDLRISVLDVGQGDAIVIEAPTGEALLVDTGPPGAGIEAILPFLAERGIADLTHIVLTHDHIDHTGGLFEVLTGPDGEAGTEDDTELEGTIYDNGTDGGEDDEPGYGWEEDTPPPDRESLSAGERIELGDVDIEVVASGARLADGTQIEPGEPPDENARSIVLFVSYRGFAMLLAADITGGGGNPPYETPDVETGLGALAGDIDVLKVAHHGSNTSTNQAFLDAVTPEIAIISAGDDNDHFHPHHSVIERLLDAGAAIYQTERGWLDIDGPIVADGNVTVEVDGDGEYRIALD